MRSSSFLTSIADSPARAIVILVALSLIPLIYAGSLTWANQDPVNRLDDVPAAVVNEDEPTTGPDDELLELGEELTETLVTSQDSDNFDWMEMSADEARHALDEGEILAMLTIPEDMSSAAASLAEEDAEEVHRSELTLVTDDAANSFTGTIAATLANEIESELVEDISAANLEELYSGYSTVESGLQDAAEGSGDLSSGAGDISEGASELEAGLNELLANYAALPDAQRQGIIQELSAGAGELSTGASDVAEGSAELEESLEESLSDVPSYSESDAEEIAEIAALPVELNVERLHEAPAMGHGLAPYFMTLALWVGAIGFFLVTPALRTFGQRRRASVVVNTLRNLLPGAALAVVQSLLMLLFLRSAVDISMAEPLTLTALVVATSIVFMAINQGLVALLGTSGRFLALVLIVLQLAAAGGTYPIETTPVFFSSIHPWFPLTYGVEGFRALILGGEFEAGKTSAVMGGWFMASVIAVGLAVWKQQRQNTDLEELEDVTDNTETDTGG